MCPTYSYLLFVICNDLVMFLQVDHLRDFLNFRFNVGIIDNIIAKCKPYFYH